MADTSNGQMTIYSNDMKSYGMRNGVAQFLNMPRDQVRVVTPREAQRLGADYLVIGRPITQATDPVATLESIRISLEEAP